MTTLTITPDIAKKRMKLAGRIAAGEKVAVTVKGFGSRPTATTRLRVLFAHNIIAQFPLPPAEGEQIVGWTVSGEDLTAVLNLNTVQAEKFTRVHAVNCLFILDDVSDGVRQLYATEDMEILRWIKTPDTDVPVNLDDFPKMLEEVRAEINAFKSEMANRANEYETSLSSAWNTYRNSLNVSIQQFTNTVMSAVNNKADAQTVNSHVQRSDNPHNVTKSQVGLGNVDNTSDVSKPVSNLQRQAIETAVSEVRRAVNSEANRADGREREIANSVDAERRRASTEEEKLDLAIRTEKEERNGDVVALRALIAAVDGMKRVIADSLPDPGEEYADKIYMIPSSNPGERNVKDEFMCFYTSSEGWQWEQIGSTAIDLDAKQDKLYTQGEQSVTNIPAQVDTTPVHDSGRLVTSGGIWSMIWGALIALPAGISSLYDWVRFFFARPIAIAPRWDTSHDYHVGDVCIESELNGSSGLLYRCIKSYRTDSESDGPSHDTEHWEEVDVKDLLDGKLDKSGDTMTGGLTVPNLTVGSRKGGSAVGAQSVAEGNNATASGLGSHAEGNNATASGYCSHAEGFGSTASGLGSHAEGVGSRTQNYSEHAQGRYNASHKASDIFSNAGNTLSSIGFGAGDNARKNAVETMQDGKTFIYGLGGYDGTNPTGAGVQDLATAINNKAPLASPAFTGTPTAPTPASDDNSTKVATTAFVKAAVEGVTPNLDYVMRVDPETGGIYYTTPDTNA